MSFYTKLTEVISESSNSSFELEQTYRKIGRKRPKPKGLINKTKEAIRNRVFVIKYVNLLCIWLLSMKKNNKVNHFKYLYPLLDDDRSKNLLLQLLAFRLIGDRVKLKNADYWSKLDDFITNVKRVPSKDFEGLELFDLSDLGLHIYGTTFSVFNQFFLQQYAFNIGSSESIVRKGDYIIEAGGCWGETSIFFSPLVGEAGRVYSFEFVDYNLQTFHENIRINKNLLNNIEIIEQPLWSVENKAIYYHSRGDRTSLSLTTKDQAKYALTTTIDSLTIAGRISKVDLIKLDVEGAELEVLKGAENTIRKFKPKIVVALYHKVNDFSEISYFIKSLNLGYRLYLNHYTFYHEETFLFAHA